ncbi:hypothetical protein MHU86_12785 [Fragilaria crotonensis]|nr:hypothetical protein MHU86_12785 [Fragilaria crotonensis]
MTNPPPVWMINTTLLVVQMRRPLHECVIQRRQEKGISTAALAQDGHDRIINQVAPQVIDQGRSPQSQGNRIPRDSLKAAQDMWKTIFQRQSQSTELNPTTRPVALSAANQRCNQPWGDILEAKESTVTRVFALNVNGLSLDRRGGQFATLCGVQKEIQADILCGRSEHNLDTLQPKVRSILYDTSRQYWDRNKMIFGTSPIPFHSVYKPGGTFMITTGNLTGRVVHQSADHWGRWVTQEFQGRGTTSISPRFTQMLMHYQQQGFDMLVLGDFDEHLGSDAAGMSLLTCQLELVDLMASRHSSPPPATYSRGTKRLDYALGSAQVSRALRRCGYEAFNARFHSDHRGYHLDFDTEILFGTDTQRLAERQPRILASNNVHQVTAYISRKHALLEQHNVFQRAQRLHHPGNRHKFAEKLDKDIVAASLASELSLPRFDTPDWSVELAQA